MQKKDYDIELIAVRSGFNGEEFYAQARAGAIPRQGRPPIVVLTAQPALRSGTDVYFALSEWRTEDMGRTWDGPVQHSSTLGRRKEPGGVEAAICDMTPSWHDLTGKLLITGHTKRYCNDRCPMSESRRETAYSVYNAEKHVWTPWRTVDMPRKPGFQRARAGSAQRVDLDSGEILLPFYFRAPHMENLRSSAVMRCAFNGKTLSYMEHGNELSISDPRGFSEPSLIRFQDRFFLTLRNDLRGYVTASEDGLHFETPVPWCFDDGSELGSYNTQQHWISHDDALFLVYTRRGLDNDNVFRHRAPLMIAQVNPDNYTVMRDTERELVPNRGARLGNFGVCNVTADENWVVVAEWMQPGGCEKYGSDNTIWVARIRWQL